MNGRATPSAFIDQPTTFPSELIAAAVPFGAAERPEIDHPGALGPQERVTPEWVFRIVRRRPRDLPGVVDRGGFAEPSAETPEQSHGAGLTIGSLRCPQERLIVCIRNARDADNLAVIIDAERVPEDPVELAKILHCAGRAVCRARRPQKGVLLPGAGHVGEADHLPVHVDRQRSVVTPPSVPMSTSLLIVGVAVMLNDRRTLAAAAYTLSPGCEAVIRHIPTPVR